MAGKDFSSALTYHEATKHSEVSIGASAHHLDWNNKPAQFKEYKNLASFALPRNFPRPEENSIKAIKGETKDAGANQIDIGVLSELLFFSAGLTRKMRFGKECYYMRAASATGALYPIELYVICGRIPGLEAGVYHFNPLHFSLAKLREGDYRASLDYAGSSHSLSAPLTLAFTSLAWRSRLGPSKRTIPPTTPAFPLRESGEDLSPRLDEVILLRGSTRKFAKDPISFDRLSTIIRASATKIPLDFLPDNETLIDFYFIANDVQGLSPGSYFYDMNTESIEQLKVLRNRSMSGYLCLGQHLFSDASVVFFLMTDLDSALKSLGNRGYRAAQFEAGVRAGQIYLSSYAVGIGASGSTFFDDAVTEFFSPHANKKSPMIAVGVGVPAYTARSGRVLPQMTTKS